MDTKTWIKKLEECIAADVAEQVKEIKLDWNPRFTDDGISVEVCAYIPGECESRDVAIRKVSIPEMLKELYEWVEDREEGQSLINEIRSAVDDMQKDLNLAIEEYDKANPPADVATDESTT